MVVTKTSGDALYYSVSNPSSYITTAYASANYPTLAQVILKNDKTQNTSLYLVDGSNSTNPFGYDYTAAAFYFQNKSGTAKIDIYNPTPYISGFNLTGINSIDAQQVYIKGVPEIL